MDTVKEVLSFTGALVGLLTALIPVFARVVDKTRRARRAEKRQAPVPQLAYAQADDAIPVLLAVADDGDDDEPVYVSAKQLARARALVKAPAIALLVTGFLGLGFNVIVAGYGFVDAFVTPLNRTNPADNPFAQVVAGPLAEPHQARAERDEEATAVITIVMMLTFAVASAMAMWAGFNMIRLKSYWLSVAGSFAIMPGGCMCCLAGIPVGIWSLSVLLKPEVSESFT